MCARRQACKARSLVTLGGSKVTPTGKSDDGAWWKISYSNQDAYIFASYAVAGGTYGSTAAVTGNTSAVQVTSDFLNVRSGPGLGNAVIGKLDGGASVQTTGKSADGAWLKISYSGQEAFIYAAYTTGGNAAPVNAPATPSPAIKGAGNFEAGGHIRSFDFLPQMREKMNPRSFLNAEWVATETEVGKRVFGMFQARIEKQRGQG